MGHYLRPTQISGGELGQVDDMSDLPESQNEKS